MTKYRVMFAAAILVLLAGCGSESSGGNQVSYKEMKSMVVDILNSNEGRKAVQEASSLGSAGNLGMKMLSTKEGEQVQLAVKEVLTNTSSYKILEKIMTDPKFAGEFAKAIHKDNKKIHKDLLKDPEYQKSMLDIMKTPDYAKIVMESMQSPAYRKQTMQVMQQSLQSPLVKLELLDLLKKVIQDEMKPQSGQKSGGESGGGGSGSGE